LHFIVLAFFLLYWPTFNSPYHCNRFQKWHLLLFTATAWCTEIFRHQTNTQPHDNSRRLISAVYASESFCYTKPYTSSFSGLYKI
jgi:hypothetical protein